MKKVFHILNGDALKEIFPNNISGEQIIMRECLVDGPVGNSTDPHSLSKFYEIRSSFLHDHYGIKKSIYHNTSMSAIEWIRQIQKNTQVYLWFEDDLFCQVNMWFVCSLFVSKNEVTTSLVRPPLAYSSDTIPNNALQYGFGGLTTPLLESAFDHALPISNQELLSFSRLWQAYVNRDEIKLLEISKLLEKTFDFISPAVNACIELWADHPKQLLDQIKTELKTDNFGKIFQAFNERGAIYGFGDLQVKRILDQLD